MCALPYQQDDDEYDSDDDDLCVWKPVFVVATADKYLHILGRRNLHGMPRKSFNLQVHQQFKFNGNINSICIHTYMHAYIHIYRHTVMDIHTYILSYLHT